MAKLHFSLDGNSLGEFSLDKERTTIGRRPANDIHIDNLAVSGDHAVITTIGNDSFLEDLDSTNGTMVNKKPVKKHVLHHGDVIEFGKYQLKYANITQEKTAAKGNGFENTVVLRPAKLDVTTPAVKVEEKAVVPAQAASTVVPSNSDAAPSVVPKPAAETASKTSRLQVLSGENAGRELLLNKALTTLGKPGVQVAVITKRPHGYYITHVEGEKKPLVNGQSVGGQAYELSDRDVIDLVGIKLEFYLA
jgi:pSer/pThr/pTyr-binding forkhead associated (FHA) protein